MSKIIKTYNQLPPQVKQSINNVAAKAARSAVQTVATKAAKVKVSQSRSRTTRTRNGMRVYSPNDVVETRAVAPVSYATSWTSGNKSLRIHQTEVIGRVSANSTWFPSWNQNYSVATFPINPANPRTFPWLSYIARLYDKYRFHGLRFIYVNAVSTQQEGNVMMSLDYDTLDAAPADLVQASQLAKYRLTPIYYPCDFAVPVNHPGNNPWLYTFDLSATTNTVDLKTYNLGNFFLSLDGVPQDGKDYGYLAVEYDVELLDKNPAINVFASKTYDSGAPAAKKTRSNVDPADTMDVTTAWSSPSSATTSKTCTLTFSDDVDTGAHVRVQLTLSGAVKSTLTSTTYATVGFSTTITAPEGVTVLSTTRSTGAATTSAAIQSNLTVNLDIEMPESHIVELGIAAASESTFETNSVLYKSLVMAYTYD